MYAILISKVLRLTRVNSGSHSYLPPTRTSTSGTRHRVSTSTHWHVVFLLCWHSNETRAPIGNPPNSAQLEGTPYHSPRVTSGSVQ